MDRGKPSGSINRATYSKIGVLALSGILAPALFTTAVIVCSGLRPQYSHLTQFMSELGESGGIHAGLMNYGGFIPTGLLLVAFSGSLHYSFRHDLFSLFGAELIGIFGAGVMAAGIFSCDSGCPLEDVSAEAVSHNVASVFAFLAGIYAPLIWGFHFRKLEAWRPFSTYSFLSTAVAVVFSVAMVASVESRFLTGLWQRICLGSIFQWCAVVGRRVYRNSGERTNEAG